MEFVVGMAERGCDPGGGGQVLVELPFLHLAREVGGIRHERALSMARHDVAFGFEVEVGALHGDDADAQVGGQGADGRELLAGGPVTGGDAQPDLLHDLEVHRPGVRLGYVQATVHSVYTQYILPAVDARGCGTPAENKSDDVRAHPRSS